MQLLTKPKNLDHYDERRKLVRSLFMLWSSTGYDEHLRIALKAYDETRAIYIKETTTDKTDTYCPENYWEIKKFKKVA